MSLRVCAQPGCPKLGDWTRCPDHTREQDRERGRRQARGYDAAHDQLGRDYQRRINQGEAFTCWRCHGLLGPKRGVDWVLGHCDTDRTKHHGPEHPRCNNATSGRTGCPHPDHRTNTRSKGVGATPRGGP